MNSQVGGCCFSELRCAYEVTNDKKNWEIIMGENKTSHYHGLDFLSFAAVSIVNNKTIKEKSIIFLSKEL